MTLNQQPPERNISTPDDEGLDALFISEETASGPNDLADIFQTDASAAGSDDEAWDEAEVWDDADLAVLFAQLTPSSALRAVSFTVVSSNADMAICRLFDGTEATLPSTEWFSARPWRPGVHAFGVLTSENPRLLSVTRPELVELLISGIVPEIREGLVQVRGVSRLPGIRSKVAVVAADPSVDAVSACVGRKANRVKALIDVLGGERVDIVAWSADREKLLAAALAPAEVSAITFDGRRAKVFVPSHRMAATVGAGGLNAQLAGRLAGYKVQVFAEV